MAGTPVNSRILQRQRRWISRLGAVSCWFVVLLPGATAGSPTDASQLEKGVFLVAGRDLAGSLFEKTVIFITDYDANGAVGLIINRPTDIPLTRLLPDVHKPAQNTDKLYIGGPVVPRGLFLLMRTDRSHAAQNRVIADVSFAVGIDALIHMLKNAGPTDVVRAYSGYAGWQPGQLEAEISHGDWLVVHDDTALIFDADPRRIWVDLMKKWSGHWL